MTEPEVLDFILERLKMSFAVQKLILFGSRARGTAESTRDYDVLIVADSELPFVERQGRALLALGKRNFPIDLLGYTPVELEKAAAVPGSAVYWALKEGKVYA